MKPVDNKQSAMKKAISNTNVDKRETRSYKFSNVRSRYLQSSPRTRPNDNNLSRYKSYENLSLAELGDELYRLAIKKRDDEIFNIHKEICKRYEDIINSQNISMKDLEIERSALKEKLIDNNNRLENLIQESEEQISTLDEKVKSAKFEINRLTRQVRTLTETSEADTSYIHKLEDERDELRTAVEALKGTIQELKNVSPTLTNNTRYRLHYDSDNDQSYGLIDLTDNQQLFVQSKNRKSLAAELENVDSETNSSVNNNVNKNNSSDNNNYTKILDNSSNEKIPEGSESLKTDENHHTLNANASTSDECNEPNQDAFLASSDSTTLEEDKEVKKAKQSKDLGSKSPRHLTPVNTTAEGDTSSVVVTKEIGNLFTNTRATSPANPNNYSETISEKTSTNYNNIPSCSPDVKITIPLKLLHNSPLNRKYINHTEEAQMMSEREQRNECKLIELEYKVNEIYDTMKTENNIPNKKHENLVEILCNEIILCKETLQSHGNQIHEIGLLYSDLKEEIHTLKASNSSTSPGKQPSTPANDIITVPARIERPNDMNETCNVKNDNQDRIEIIGDSHARGLKTFLSKKLPHNTHIIESYKSGANMSSLHTLINPPTHHCCKFIMFIGSNDIKRTPFNEMIKSLDDCLFKINHNEVIFVLLPMRLDYPNLNENINNVNTKLKYHLLKNHKNVLIVNPRNFINESHYAIDGQHLNRFGKVQVAQYLQNSLKNYKKFLSKQSNIEVCPKQDPINCPLESSSHLTTNVANDDSRMSSNKLCSNLEGEVITSHSKKLFHKRSGAESIQKPYKRNPGQYTTKLDNIKANQMPLNRPIEIQQNGREEKVQKEPTQQKQKYPTLEQQFDNTHDKHRRQSQQVTYTNQLRRTATQPEQPNKIHPNQKHSEQQLNRNTDKSILTQEDKLCKKPIEEDISQPFQTQERIQQAILQQQRMGQISQKQTQQILPNQQGTKEQQSSPSNLINQEHPHLQQQPYQMTQQTMHHGHNMDPQMWNLLQQQTYETQLRREQLQRQLVWCMANFLNPMTNPTWGYM
uniref:Uncharacterized protein n=1 Tax=Cacopsylla melanoneura TaxID=428564 RepID=A0A8D8QPL2_9HEMI